MKLLRLLLLLIFGQTIYGQIQASKDEKKDTCSIFVPTVTGPHCEINDQWIVRPECPLKEFSIFVCDRWGKKMYQQDSLGKYGVINWDFYKPEVSNGNYYWLIRYKTTFRENEKELRGTVLILR